MQKKKIEIKNKILINRKEGQLKKMSVVIILILLITIVSATAQNILKTSETQEQVLEFETTEMQENITLQLDEFEIIDQGDNKKAENFEEVEESEQNVTGETSELNESEDDNIIKSDGNEITHLEQNETILPLMEEETKTPQLEIQLIHPEKITRGENIELKAIITNLGNKTGYILMTWDLPSGFEIISENKIQNCGNLNNGEICEFQINIKSSISTSSGINEIKIKGHYENGI